MLVSSEDFTLCGTSAIYRGVHFEISLSTDWLITWLIDVVITAALSYTHTHTLTQDHLRFMVLATRGYVVITDVRQRQVEMICYIRRTPRLIASLAYLQAHATLLIMHIHRVGRRAISDTDLCWFDQIVCVCQPDRPKTYGRRVHWHWTDYEVILL